MGLDITVFPKVELVDHVRSNPEDLWCDNEEHRVAFVYEGFEQSLRGLKQGGCYICYWTDGDQEGIGFRAGSYSGYGYWRSTLWVAANAGMEATAVDEAAVNMDLPFAELVWFADNEGTIGPEAAADLYRDFIEQRTKVFANIDKGFSNPEAEYFKSRYADWTDAMRIASKGGMVVFH